MHFFHNASHDSSIYHAYVHTPIIMTTAAKTDITNIIGALREQGDKDQKKQRVTPGHR